MAADDITTDLVGMLAAGAMGEDWTMGESNESAMAAACRDVEQRYVPLWLTTVFAPDVSEAFDALGVGAGDR